MKEIKDGVNFIDSLLLKIKQNETSFLEKLINDEEQIKKLISKNFKIVLELDTTNNYFLLKTIVRSDFKQLIEELIGPPHEIVMKNLSTETTFQK